MPLPPSTKEVEKMVRTKLRYQHPKLYKELLASGQLDKVAKERADVFDQIFSEVASSLSLPHLKQGVSHEDGEKGLFRARDQATEQALAAALEFPEDSESNPQAA